ncbi:hypothetical protein RZS08_08900, partial [Arthrospira platensis SPKY1]|nr:hypothetical protein [Arthrospira platensis SPKY1]
MVVSDAISSNTTGYIKNYTIIRETPLSNRFEIMVKANVTTQSLQADFQLLSKAIGGVRFLVMVDPKETKGPSAADLQNATDRINSFLAQRQYRYVDKTRFESLRHESMNMMEDSNSSLSYVQQLGIMSDAQFIIVLSELSSETIMGAFDIPRGNRVSFLAKAYDNCTGEGLGTLVLESTSNGSNNANGASNTM